MSQIILEVPDISCAHCEHTVRGTLEGRPGVEAVQVSIPAKTVYLQYDPATLDFDQMRAALDEEGYPVAAMREGAAPPTPKGPVIPLHSH